MIYTKYIGVIEWINTTPRPLAMNLATRTDLSSYGVIEWNKIPSTFGREPGHK